MQKMENWAEEINAKIDVNLEKSREKDILFFRVAEFKRNVARVGEFSKSCPFCNKHKIDIAETVGTIQEAVEVPGKSRREFDRLITRLARHMQKEHGYYAPYYFSYLYAFIGILSSLIVGYILFKIFPADGELLLLVSIMVGIVASYIAGTQRDNKIRSSKKLM
ncbi:hypothetical protein MASR2M47_39370 [Draconibacterium sp.]